MIASLALTPGGDREGMGDEKDGERSPATVFTVSEVPSRQTDPFSAMKRDRLAGARRVKRSDGAHCGSPSPRHGVAGHEFGQAVHVARDEVAAELVSDPQGAFEVQAPAFRHWPTWVRARVSAAASMSKMQPPPSVRVRRP